MDLYLQFGHGMQELSQTLTKQWSGGCVIISPRDIDESRVPAFAERIGKAGGECLFDPQFYLPDADHARLISYDYWPRNYSTTQFWSGRQVSELVGRIVAMNRSLSCKGVILPGLFAHSVDKTWLRTQEVVRSASLSVDTGGLPRFATIALSEVAATSESQIAALMDDAATWDVDGVYLVCEHPRGDYLVADASWVANVLDVIAGFRLAGKEVIVGYCNHQLLLAGCSAASAIASGNWMNVRSFPPEKFRVDPEDEQKQRATWFYCPQALSEFKVTFLDIARRQNKLDLLKTPRAMENEHSDMLFQGRQPSASGFKEGNAFRHYLMCLRHQTMRAVKPTFDETIQHHYAMLDQAEKTLRDLHKSQITGQNRDFGEAIAVNRAALAALEATQGARLRRSWSRLV
jgi:hypothetical protein